MSQEIHTSPQSTRSGASSARHGPEISVIGYRAWEAGGGYHSVNPPTKS